MNMKFRDACDYLASQLQPVSAVERNEWITKVTEFLQKKKSLSDPVVEKSHIVSAVDVSNKFCVSTGNIQLRI